MRRMKSLKQDTTFTVLAANLLPQGFIGAKAAIWFIMSEYGRCESCFFRDCWLHRSRTTPEAVMNFHHSREAQQRLAVLIEREKAGSVSPEEKAELDHFMELEHILRMAKARARHILSRDK